MTDQRVPGYIKIATRFKNFSKELRDIWENYNIIKFYTPLLHNSVKKKQFPSLSFVPLFSRDRKNSKIDDTLGAFSSMVRKSSPRSAIIESVIAFEDFLSFVILSVYQDYPGKLLSVNNDANNESASRQSKLLKVIIESSDKEEIIDKLIEEKSRSIFYGNIVDFFLKDPAKLEFKDHFKGDLKNPIKKDLAEILAKRNIIVHNNGKIDRKYIRETGCSPKDLGTKIQIDAAYLKHAIVTLQGIAAHTSGQVIDAIYKQPVKGRTKIILNSYNNYLKT